MTHCTIKYENVSALAVSCNYQSSMKSEPTEDYLALIQKQFSPIPLLVRDSDICSWCPITVITSAGPVSSYHTGPPSPILIEIWLYGVTTCWPSVWPFCLSAVHKFSCLQHSEFAFLASQQGPGSHVVVTVVSFSLSTKTFGNWIHCRLQRTFRSWADSTLWWNFSITMTDAIFGNWYWPLPGL